MLQRIRLRRMGNRGNLRDRSRVVGEKPLRRHVIVTSGPTHEPIDPVGISQPIVGRQGMPSPRFVRWGAGHVGDGVSIPIRRVW